MEQASGKRVCRTCDQSENDVAFYATGSECRTCKKARSKRNRQEQARVHAIAERLVDALYLLAGEPVHAPRARTAKRGRAAIPAPASPSTTALLTREMQS